MKRFLLTLCAVCATTFAWAATEVVNGITLYYSVSSGKATITDCNSGASGVLEIPETLDGVPVTSIGNYAFQYCYGLTSVTIPEGVTSIGVEAFRDCTGLTSVTILEGVTSIGGYAFYNCSGLTSVTIPSSVTSIGSYAFSRSGIKSFRVPIGVTILNEAVFDDCSDLTSLVLPEGLTKINRWAIDGCESLVSLNLPSTLKELAGESISNCPLLTSVTIPSSVTSIGYEAFYNCSGLTSVTILEGVTSIGSYAFSGCSGLISFSLPASVIEMPTNALPPSSVNLKVLEVAEGNLLYYTNPEKTLLYTKDKSTLLRVAKGGISGEVSLEDGLTTIPNYAFRDCSGLTSITIPEGVTSIGDSAFRNCTGLTSVTIPSSVISIGSYAFDDCTGLKEVHISDVAAWCAIDFIQHESNPLYYANNLYLNNELVTNLIIPENVISIKDRVFLGCANLISVTIPSSVTSIGYATFSGCLNLSSIIIPESVISIDKWVFEDCSSLTSVTIPEGVTSIEHGMFSGCTGLTSVTIPSSVTSIGYDAFYNCSGLKTVRMEGPVPLGFTSSGLSNYQVAYPKEYGADYKAILGTSHSYIGVISTADVTVSAEMTTPQTMKVTYSVTSDLPTVKVRAVAFADGVRSFAKIVPVKNGENVPLGGEVASNTEHTFIWNVSEDWDTDLSKVAIEILVQEGELLPQELLTIPAVGDNKAMTITRNTITTSMAFNALLWCIAEGDEALTIASGVVRANNTQIASGKSVSQNANLLNYLYGKMGYKVLAGDDLTYARNATRINFPNSGIGQRAIKIEE